MLCNVNPSCDINSNNQHDINFENFFLWRSCFHTVVPGKILVNCGNQNLLTLWTVDNIVFVLISSRLKNNCLGVIHASDYLLLLRDMFINQNTREVNVPFPSGS